MNGKPPIVILAITCTAIFHCCRTNVYVQAPSHEFTGLLKDSAIKYEGLLNFEGVYHYIDSSNYHHGTDYKNGQPTKFVDTPYLDRPVFFFKNNLMVFDNFLALDSSVFFQSMEKYGTQESAFLANWGVYKIENNMITAILYYPYTGGNILGKGLTQRWLTYFQGYLKNRDTITGWHMIPPYPEINIGPNQYDFDFFKKPRDLYFKKVPIDKLVDPAKAWINKYKTE